MGNKLRADLNGCGEKKKKINPQTLLSKLRQDVRRTMLALRAQHPTSVPTPTVHTDWERMVVRADLSSFPEGAQPLSRISTQEAAVHWSRESKGDKWMGGDDFGHCELLAGALRDRFLYECVFLLLFIRNQGVELTSHR